MEIPESSLRDSKIVVTGGNGNLGSSIIEYLLAEGAVVYSVDLPGKRAPYPSRANSSKSSFIQFTADLLDTEQRIRFASELSAVTSRVDGLIHCAAYVGTSGLSGWSVPFEAQSLDSWRNAIEINLTAPFHISQLLLPLLQESSAPSIVGVASIYGHFGPDWRIYEGSGLGNPAAYAASKGGLIQLFRWLATTLAPTIRVNTVSPGGIVRNQPETFVTRYENRVPLGRMARESDITGIIAFLLSEKAAYITGQDFLVDGGYSAW